MNIIPKTTKRVSLLLLAFVLAIASVRSMQAAGSKTDFGTAYAAAEAANKQAGHLRNQWTVTAEALAAAKKAADKGDFDTRSRRRKRPKRWPRHRSSRQQAKKTPGRISKYTEVL
jgi:hypothetical protein